MPEGPILAPSVAVLKPGRNRFGFALFDVSRKQLNAAKVAVYVASADGSGVKGPYPVRDESLAVSPAYRSQTTAKDPARRALGVRRQPQAQVRQAPRARAGRARRAGRRLVADLGRGRRHHAAPPTWATRRSASHTPTAADVGGDLSKIDTRVPPAPSLHKDDFADVLGKKPVVLVFATPQLCQSRVCGPVVDIEAQVQQKYGDKVVVHPRGDLQGQRPQQGLPAPVGSGTWRPSRGRS